MTCNVPKRDYSGHKKGLTGAGFCGGGLIGVCLDGFVKANMFFIKWGLIAKEASNEDLKKIKIF